MKPYPYQIEGINWLIDHPHAICGDQPGLGKTMQTVQAIVRRYPHAREPQARFLVICSKSAMTTWANEIKVWGDHKRAVITLPDGKPRRTAALENFEAGWLIVNREAVRLFADELIKIGWWAIVNDEAHHARSRPSKHNSQTGKIEKSAGRSQFVACLFKLKAQTQYAISATLLDGDSRDLWPTLHWLFPKSFSSYWKWALEYCEFEQDGYSMYGTYVGPKNTKQMRERLAPLIIRRLKEEVAADLPPLTRQTIDIELNDGERKVYDAMEADMLAEFENGEIVEAPIAVAQMIRLQQFTTFATAYDPAIKSTKLEWVLDYLSGVPVNHKLVIVSHFKAPLITLHMALTARGCGSARVCALLVGSVAAGPVIADFQSPTGSTKILLTTIAKGGESITLSAADTMIVLEKTWSSIEWEQLMNRIHRNDALTRTHSNINIISLVATNTIDEAVESLLYSKQVVNDSIIVSTAIAAMQARQQHKSSLISTLTNIKPGV